MRRPLEELHFATLWEEIADRLPESPALRHGDRLVTWGDFEERAARLASGLQAHGIGRADSVACYLYNGPEYFEVFFGSLKMRAMPANVNYRYGGHELADLLDNSGARALVFDVALRDQVASAVAGRPGLMLIEVGAGGSTDAFPGAVPYEEILAGSTPAARITRSVDDAFLSYTGGTTGLPKGVLYGIGRGVRTCLTLRDRFLGTTTNREVADYAVELAATDRSMQSIPAAPLMHSTGFTYTSLPTLTAGGTVTTLVGRSFDASELLATIGAVGAAVIGIVGDAFALPIVRALDAGPPTGGRYETASLRTICSAGVAWSAPVKARLLDHLPKVTLVDSCGCTEGVTYGFRQVRRGDLLSTANFEPAPGLKVLSSAREELPPGEVGLLAGPTPASGYHQDLKRSTGTFFHLDGEPYAAPGDLGRIESDGTLTLVGRGVTTINTGGEKVYPGEVEDTIRQLADVDDCLVLGVPDERFGECVTALVVVSPGRELTPAEVVEPLRRSLAGYKLPRRLRFVAAVPRLPNGKVDYPAATRLVETATPARAGGTGEVQPTTGLETSDMPPATPSL